MSSTGGLAPFLGLVRNKLRDAAGDWLWASMIFARAFRCVRVLALAGRSSHLISWPRTSLCRVGSSAWALAALLRPRLPWHVWTVVRMSCVDGSRVNASCGLASLAVTGQSREQHTLHYSLCSTARGTITRIMPWIDRTRPHPPIFTAGLCCLLSIRVCLSNHPSRGKSTVRSEINPDRVL